MAKYSKISWFSHDSTPGVAQLRRIPGVAENAARAAAHAAAEATEAAGAEASKRRKPCPKRYVQYVEIASPLPFPLLKG